ncbi:WD domain, G-beta repeat-containing protein [Toxoplasma gondii p89]|uniref:Dynein axonemal intermediate chain 4 n=1 Tax=Toxoplasma gondii p89 TaxID=943119 RepID=A0A086JB57_TOXGO|nr:WD domain, G-beta repeat-containing protein [Toxoplasma gondii p89]
MCAATVEMASQHGNEWRGDQKDTSTSQADADEDDEGPKSEDGFLLSPGATRHSQEVSEELLETQVEIMLQESATEIYFVQPSLVVLVDTEEFWRLTNRNKEYDDLAASKNLTEKYVVNHSQTLNLPQKNKEISAVPAAPVSTKVSVSPADIFDAFNAVTVPRIHELQHQWMNEAQSYMDKGLKMPGSLLDVNSTFVQLNYQFHLSSASRRVASSDTSDGSATKDVTTISLHKGYTALKTRRNDGPIAGVGSRDSSRKVGVGAGPSLLHGGNSTRSIRRHRPSIQISGSGSATDEKRGPQAAAREEISQFERLAWQIGKEAPLPRYLQNGLVIIERLLAQTRYHYQHMSYRNFSKCADPNSGVRQTNGPSIFRRLPPPDEHKRPDGLSMQMNEDENHVGQASADMVTGALTNEDHTDHESEEDSDDRNTTDDEQIPQQNCSTAKFRELFDFDGRALTSSMSVSTVNWNPGNQDLLAVAYGTSPAPRSGVPTDGWILFWSLRNPLVPERKLHTPSGVLSLHFSSFNSNLLAAGMADGHVVLWDLRKPTDQPVLQTHPVLSVQGSSRHSDAVWDVRWVDRGAEKVPREQLLSIGGDGKVYQWTMKKVMEKTTIMSMKRVVNPRTKVTWNTNGVDPKNDAVVFMYASGLCIDISGKDASTYIIGTDEGLVHRCSTSYNEQYLDTYVGHTGPINRVSYNPFDSEVFSSCSDDGTIRLWNVKHPETAVATLPPSTHYSAVTDFSWFALNCPVLAVGDKEGCSTVIKAEDEDIPRYSSLEQKERLQAVTEQQAKHWVAM